MRKTRTPWMILLALLLSACQGAPTTASSALPSWTAIPIPATAPGGNSAPTIPPLPAVTTTAIVGQIPADAVILNGAADAARGYFAALEAGDCEAAASFYSSFSLMLDGLTRSEASLALQGEMASGTKWSALDVRDITWFNSQTGLIHVVYHKETKDAKTGATSQASMDELWPMRMETGKWRYNRSNLIDYRVLDVAEQATGGLIVKPRQITRFSDRMRLTLVVQNTTNEAIVLGQANEILAKFQFKDRQVEAVKKQMIFDRLRTNPQVTIEVLGLYESYPDSVIIRQWKNYKVKPWFSFRLTE